MKTKDLFLESYTALLTNKVRSGLTVLGIVIGIGSVIAMVSIGQGASGQIQSNIEGLGSNLLTVIPGALQAGRGMISGGRGTAQTLKIDDVGVLKQINGVLNISPEFQRRFQIVSSVGNNTNSNVIGVRAEYATVRNVSPQNGSFISNNQVDSMSKVAVLGPTVAQDLFGDVDPLGKTIRINKVNFKVIGVLEPKGSSGFFDPDDAVFVPLTTMQKTLTGVDYLSTIAISVETKEMISQVQEEVIDALVSKHQVDPQNPDFSVVSQADILGALTQVTDTLTVFLAAVAGISLIVGGIGIMNMMLTTVTERTREIGLRKAIGAKKKDISKQFLLEAIILTFLGGIVGIFLGWILSMLISNFAGVTTKISLSTILLAFGISALIGITFGYYPAKRAASLNPIEALRYE